MLSLLLALACDFSAASKVVGEDTALDGGADDTADIDGDTSGRDSGETHTGDTDTGDTDTEDTGPPDPLRVDDDGDGWSEAQGDCDDADLTVHPDAVDVCNAIDDDCDDDIDEDADPDGYEPNDTSAVTVGSLDDDPELSAVATISGEVDVDRYSFSFSDSSWSLFTVSMTLSGIPDDATWRFTLNRLSSEGDLPAEEVDQVFGSGSLSMTLSDVVLQDDGGTYELVVESISGADCGRSYLLAVAW
ncbi:MAG: MopE-related protein [Pseudomonadota bacterium]|nr:MopE-related protein [Pseudomonadota bacterium]